MAEPIGSVNELLVFVVPTITVPSINGAKPGKNLEKQNR